MTSPVAWYNEPDPFAANWLESLIGRGLITGGLIDRRTIQRIRHTPAFPTNLFVYPQCHFFAGIGGWSYALRLAGWPDHLPVWTGSCPCQPFSNAGSKRGTDDDRHLWPYFCTFIAKYLPPTIFGEQTAGPLGRLWLASVRADLEKLGYRVGAADLCAAGVGAPHIRQRLYWVADAEHTRLEGWRCSLSKKRTEQSKVELCRIQSSWKQIDSKGLPTQPKLFPLADGVPSRVGRLRGYGNAIVPQLAAEFIGAYMDIAGIMR